MGKYFLDTVEDKRKAVRFLEDVKFLTDKTILIFFCENIRDNEELVSKYGIQPVLAVANYIKDRPFVLILKNKRMFFEDEGQLRDFIDINEIDDPACFNYKTEKLIDIE